MRSEKSSHLLRLISDGMLLTTDESKLVEWVQAMDRVLSAHSYRRVT